MNNGFVSGPDTAESERRSASPRPLGCGDPYPGREHEHGGRQGPAGDPVCQPLPSLLRRQADRAGHVRGPLAKPARCAGLLLRSLRHDSASGVVLLFVAPLFCLHFFSFCHMVDIFYGSHAALSMMDLLF